MGVFGVEAVAVTIGAFAIKAEIGSTTTITFVIIAYTAATIATASKLIAVTAARVATDNSVDSAVLLIMLGLSETVVITVARVIAARDAAREEAATKEVNATATARGS